MHKCKRVFNWPATMFLSIFESPYFKVRVGNFQTRNDAEILLEEVTKKGYETAFIVQAKSSQ